MSTVQSLANPIDGLDNDVREITTLLDRLEATVEEAIETGADTSELDAELGKLSESIDKLDRLESLTNSAPRTTTLRLRSEGLSAFNLRRAASGDHPERIRLRILTGS